MVAWVGQDLCQVTFYCEFHHRKDSDGLALRAETDSSDNRRIVLEQAYSSCATIAPTRQEERIQPDF